MKVYKILFITAVCLLFSVSDTFAQCGADGTQPCNTTPKKTAKKTKKPTVSKPTTSTKKPQTTAKKTIFVPTVYVNSEEQMIGISPKGDKLEVVSFEYDERLDWQYRTGMIVKYKYSLNSAPSCRIWVRAFAKGKEIYALGGSNIFTGNGEGSSYVGWDKNETIDEIHLWLTDADGYYKNGALLLLVVRLKGT